MSRIVRPRHGATSEFVRCAAYDTTGRVLLMRRGFGVALGGFYELPGGRVERQGDVLRPLVMERELCNKFNLVVRSSVDSPIEGGVGQGGQFFRSYTYRAKILGGDPVYDTDTYQTHLQIEPEEALKFSEFLTPECCKIVGMLAARPKDSGQSHPLLQQVA